MLYELLISNMITGFFVGGCFMVYLAYKKYKEEVYYAHIRGKILDLAYLFSQSFISYMTTKNSTDLNYLKTMMSPDKVFPLHQYKCPSGNPIFMDDPWGNDMCPSYTYKTAPCKPFQFPKQPKSQMMNTSLETDLPDENIDIAI